MEWLTKYEGQKGVGALAIATACFAPTFLALFLLADAPDATKNTTFALILCASIGGTIGLLGTIINAIIETTARASEILQNNFEKSEKLQSDLDASLDKTYNNHLVGGFLASFGTQFFSLGASIFFDKPFKFYVMISIFSAIPIVIILLARFAVVAVKLKNHG